MSIPESWRPHLRLPVIVAPMFLVSGPELVLSCCKAGLVGSFPALNLRTSEEFEQWLILIRQGLADVGIADAPYAVNLIVNASNQRLAADLALCVKHRVPLIITSLGIDPRVIEAVHEYGGRVFHDVIHRRHAQKAVEGGVDGLIAVAGGAGGHAGGTNPMALIAEIRKFWSGTLALSGALSGGADIAAARALGADFAYMGTRFLACSESRAQQAYKEMVVAASSRDIVYTNQVSGVHANFLAASLEKAGIDTTQQSSPGLKSISDEAKAWRDIWSAGHGVGAIDDLPDVAALTERLENEYTHARSRLDF